MNIVESLRAQADLKGCPSPLALREGADRIERLEAIIDGLLESIINDKLPELDNRVTRLEKMRGALQACVEYWRDCEVPCPPALHDQVTTALHGDEQSKRSET